MASKSDVDTSDTKEHSLAYKIILDLKKQRQVLSILLGLSIIANVLLIIIKY